MRQTKTESLIETCLGTFIGFWISWAAWPLVTWYYDMPLDRTEQFGTTLFFTALSVARSYVVRRWCENYLKQFSRYIAKCLKN